MIYKTNLKTEINQRFKEQHEKIIQEISKQMLLLEEHYNKILTLAIKWLNCKSSNIDIQNERLNYLEKCNNLDNWYFYNYENRI